LTRAGHGGCEEMNRMMSMRGSMCVAMGTIAGIAGDEPRGASGRQKMLEETDSATNLGSRQFRRARGK
jgi:hypothetical protein